MQIDIPKIFPKDLILAGFISKNSHIDVRLEKGLNFKPSETKDLNISKQIVANHFGIKIDQIKLLDQNHDTQSAFVTSKLQTEKILADAMFSDQANVFLASKSADCPVVLLFDPVSKIIASIHSGRKGTEKNILKAVISKLEKNSNVNPKNLLAYICPSAGSNFYLVPQDVANIWEAKYKQPVDEKYLEKLTQEDKSFLEKCILNTQEVSYLLDIKSKLVDQLLELGAFADNIEVSNVCSISNLDYNSYRRDGKSFATSIGFIMLTN